MTKEVICPVCEGHGFSPIIGEYSITSHTCDHCNGSGLIKVPMTNADRIRAMGDEELARHLHCIGWDCHLCAEHIRLDNEPLLRDQRCDENCFEHCLEWLKQPAEEP